MSIGTIEAEAKQDEVVIKVAGTFNYNLRQEFRKAYENHPRNKKYIVEFHQVTTLDSSALGMLLILLEHAGNIKENLHIVGCQPKVKELFQLGNFHKLMTMK